MSTGRGVDALGGVIALVVAREQFDITEKIKFHLRVKSKTNKSINRQQKQNHKNEKLGSFVQLHLVNIPVPRI